MFNVHLYWLPPVCVDGLPLRRRFETVPWKKRDVIPRQRQPTGYPVRRGICDTVKLLNDDCWSSTVTTPFRYWRTRSNPTFNNPWMWIFEQQTPDHKVIDYTPAIYKFSTVLTTVSWRCLCLMFCQTITRWHVAFGHGLLAVLIMTLLFIVKKFLT